MPALSPTMEEGNLAKWLVKEGDTVSAGDVIAEIETDKATMEVEAVDEGTIAKILVAEGSEGVKVNAVIAVLAEDGEKVGDIDSAAAGPAAAEPAADAPSGDAAKSGEVPAIPAEVPADNAASAPVAPQPVATVAPSGGRVFASPLARRIAQQNGIEISSITGSGPHGRIVKADVEAAMAGGGAAAAVPQMDMATPPASPQVMSDAEVLALFEEGTYQAKRHDGMRKIMAERLTQSSQTIPSYFVTMECHLDTLLALRAQMNDAAPKDDEGKPVYKISVNDFIVKAMALALQAVPMANVSWTSTDRLYHTHSDIGVAVAVEDGLFTPIVRQAEQKTLSVISAEIKDMAARARSRKLLPQEYQGGCTAVSNLGMFGVREFTSIINPPHASIVSIGAGEKKPVIRDGALAVGTVMAATFAFDHRCIDGALGAELAAAFKRLVENPMGMLV